MYETKDERQAVTAWRSKLRMADPKIPAVKRSYQERLKALLAEWGQLVLWVYFGIFGSVLVGFAIAIKLGLTSAGAEGAADDTGAWGFLALMGAAYVATKLTQPLRIAATLVITPALAALLRRVRKQHAPVPGPAAAGAEPTAADNASLEPTEPSKP